MQLFEGFPRGGRRGDFRAGTFQDLLQHLSRVRIVVHGQDAQTCQPWLGLRARRDASVRCAWCLRPRLHGASFVRGAKGEYDGKARSEALARAVRHHGAAVKFAEMARNRQTQPQAAVPASFAGVRLSEAVENVRHEFCAHALAVVGYADFDLRVLARQAERNVTARRRKFHRIRQQVPDDLLQPGGIAGQRADLRIDAIFERDAARHDCRTQRLDDGMDERNQVDRLDIEPQATRADICNVEQCIDKFGLRIGACVDLG